MLHIRKSQYLEKIEKIVANIYNRLKISEKY